MLHKVTEYKLKSGARGLVIDVPGSGVYNLEAVFNSGFIFGARSKFELPHVMEHLMGSGTRTHPSAKLFKTEIEKNGAYRNAFTSAVNNGYVYECANFELDRILGLMAAQLTSPVFPAESFPTEVSNVREELSRDSSNYGRQSYSALVSATMPSTWALEKERIDQLPSLSLEDVKAYYDRTHMQANMRFLMAGDFGAKQKAVVERFESLLGEMTVGQRLEVPRETVVALGEPIVVEQPIEQIYYTLHSYFQGDYADRPAWTLLTKLLTGGYRSWLLGEARERGLAYHVAAGYALLPYAQYLVLSAYVTPPNSQELFRLIAKCLKKAQTGDFNASELEEAKNLQLGSLLRANQTGGDVIDWYSNEYLYYDKIDDFDDFMAAIKAVTKDDIVRVAQLAAADKNWALCLVGNISKDQAHNLYEILKPIW
jgi:predicted Zn-dependent peptidase